MSEEKASCSPADRQWTEEPEVEAARWRWRKAEQLALSSKYKIEFLANRSHDLPLRNSLLLLAPPYGEPGGEPHREAVEYADTIPSGHGPSHPINACSTCHDRGGRMDITRRHLMPTSAHSCAAASAGGEHTGCASTSMWPRRSRSLLHEGSAQQVLKNLLSNAFKFTQDVNSLSPSARRRAGASPTVARQRGPVVPSA